MSPEVIRLTACSTIYPDYCDEATCVLDILNDCGLKVNSADAPQNHSQKEEEYITSHLNQKDLFQLNLYPIPAKNELHLQWQNYEEGNYQITINTVSGKTVSTENLFVEKGYQNKQVAIQHLPKGLYYISIPKDGIFMTDKFMKP